MKIALITIALLFLSSCNDSNDVERLEQLLGLCSKICESRDLGRCHSFKFKNNTLHVSCTEINTEEQ
jgi:hypothetical protein